MQIVNSRPSAQIVPFPVRQSQPSRLTSLDRIQALTWDGAQAGLASARLLIHDRQPADGPEVSDYVGIYPAGGHWADWGVARAGASLTVWHAPTGSDLGSFPTMHDALAAVACAAIRPPPRLQRTRRNA